MLRNIPWEIDRAAERKLKRKQMQSQNKQSDAADNDESNDSSSTSSSTTSTGTSEEDQHLDNFSKNARDDKSSKSIKVNENSSGPCGDNTNKLKGAFVCTESSFCYLPVMHMLSILDNKLSLPASALNTRLLSYIHDDLEGKSTKKPLFGDVDEDDNDDVEDVHASGDYNGNYGKSTNVGTKSESILNESILTDNRSIDRLIYLVQLLAPLQSKFASNQASFYHFMVKLIFT
jgi:hypothetical protein